MSKQIAQLEARIERIEQQKQQARERLNKAKAQKRAADAKKQRRDDTRRKILLGAMLLNEMQNSDKTEQFMLAKLDSYLTSERDRQLFNLKDVANANDAKQQKQWPPHSS